MDPTLVVICGLIAFGIVFALNSAVHSYLILAYAEGDRVAMNVGFYYMANAGGRLAGDDPLGRAVRVAGARGLPVGVGRARARGGVDLAAPDDRAGPRGQPVDDSLMRTASSRACSSS